jgi:hypothetical protein
MRELAREKRGEGEGEERERRGSVHIHRCEHRLVQVDKPLDCSVCSHQPSGRVRTNYKCNPCGVYVCVIPCYDVHREHHVM